MFSEAGAEYLDYVAVSGGFNSQVTRDRSPGISSEFHLKLDVATGTSGGFQTIENAFV